MDQKKWWMSKGVWGSLIMIVAIVAGYFGVEIDADTQAVMVDQIVALVTAGTALVGAILALIGRIKAKSEIK